jgi:hypothetical protein
MACGINTPIMADRPKDVPGEQTGSSDEVSQILGLYAGQEAPGGYHPEYHNDFVPTPQLSNCINNSSFLQRTRLRLLIAHT